MTSLYTACNIYLYCETIIARFVTGARNTIAQILQLYLHKMFLFLVAGRCQHAIYLLIDRSKFQVTCMCTLR